MLINWAPLVLAVVMVFLLERPGEKESNVVSGLVYFLLGIFPLNILNFTIYLGLPAAMMLLIRKVENRKLKIAAALLGAVAGWVYFTWFRVPGT
jgi:hypothetical protein